MQPKTTLFFILHLLLFSALAVAGDAHALTLGKFDFQPFASVKEVFTDNVFSTPSTTYEKSDRVTYYTPGVKITFPFSVHRLDLNYSAVLTRYDEFRTEKTNDHRARGNLDLKFGSRVNLTLTDVYSKDHEPRGSSTTGFIEKFKTNTGMGTLVYQLVDRSKVQMDYAKTSWSFRNSTYRNRGESLAAAYLYYRFLPKTSVFVEYDQKQVDFNETTTPYDNTMSSALLGLVWEASSQSRGSIKAGRTTKDFANPLVKDHDVWTSSIDIRHEFTNYTSVSLNGQRMVNESNRIGTRFFVTTGMYSEIVHKFGYHLSAVVHGSVGTDAYSDVVAPETVQRKDSLSSWGGGLKYLIREWLEISADYTSRSRNSNIDASDFMEHQYSAMISASL